MRDPTVDERLEWRDLKHREEQLRAEQQELGPELRSGPRVDRRRRQKEIRRDLDLVMAAQREMAMDYWKEAIDGAG